jgi:hypothetical protein
MGGGLMQLVAYGAQDIYLTGNPQITFFKVVYRRHTNFSIESIEQTFNGTADFGKKVSCTISRNGDLVHRIYLQTTLPDQIINVATTASGGDLTVQNQVGVLDLRDGIVRWCNWVGEKMINFAEIEIGGQRIDKHYGEWLHLWNQLTNQSGHDESYQRMVGNTPHLTKNRSTVASTTATQNISVSGKRLYVPLQFWFCRNPGLALPLIALQYHEVKINIEFEELKNLFIARTTSNSAVAVQGALQNTSLWVDYIFLDTDERRRFAQLSHEYLIEQLQYPGEETITTTSNKIRLNFNHPVKELVWVAQKEVSVENMQHFNYTDSLDSSPTLTHNSQGSRMIQGIVENINDSVGGSLKLISSDEGNNTCSGAKIQLNGQDRFSERDGDYFNYVQPYNHHTRAPHVGVNVYSFALKPEEHQPSGTCNFSRIDNANLFLTVTSRTLRKGTVAVSGGILSETDIDTQGTPNNARVRVYATNYNVLRIMSGMGGLAYSN